MQNNDNITKHLMNTGVSSVAVMVVTFVTGIVLARVLGSEARGIYGAAQFWGQFAAFYLNFAFFDSAIITLRNSKGSPATKTSTIFFGAAAIFICSVMIVLLGVLTFGVSVEGVNASFFVVYMALAIAISFAHQSITAVESSELEFRYLNVERVASPVIFLILIAALFYYSELTVYAALVSLILSKMPTLVIRLFRYSRYLIHGIDLRFLREVTKLAPKLYVSTATLGFASQIDKLVIVNVWPSVWLGYYFVAYSAAGAGMALVSQAINIVVLPHLAGTEGEAKRALVARLFRVSLMTGISFAFPLWLLAPVLVPFVYGQEFLSAADFLRGLVFPASLLPVISVVGAVNRANAEGRPGVEMAIALSAVFLTGFVVTGFEKPEHLFATMFAANLASIIAGLRGLSRSDSIGRLSDLVPNPNDAIFLIHKSLVMIKKVTRS